ncbi:sulfite exporter TauE/SafE family protein [Enterococcus dongliensis]|uniref:Probable membrane transporter protein n=1 Tax=Enterococcus dongliensis TaxID=2559925 RepID=A0AAW8TIG3_9ENTE|nr:sulfite exporter TauE/SafE family protein [Enterococcus dongliensis]MDT2597136.1 sulfite exporter TauE/SafE family protein [Enterococcus dongliensis]MDT2638089.1 sulfite exporter TauE/SafE family protein [Enterococcus dongliensis]MDT2642941.1 sulfite exporter TauE/SafE family protein [Enterococcus dongliensis]MDT2648249.1 sulfite exporter TauE/SafE family protein [Enterococcus dongliensis]
MLISQIGLLLVTGGFAGILGSILGIGGGIILTPFLTLVMGLEIKYAIAASIVCVIATSSGATIAYLKDDMLNLRVAMFLEIATTIGAIVGAILSGIVPTDFLFLLFGGFLLFSVINMIQKLRGKSEALSNEAIGDPLAEKLKLNGSYYDKVLEKQIDYQVEKVPGGFAMMFGAGIASGLLGIGSGVFKVTAMDTIMKMPLKPSSATSNLMMGVTAAASAMVYFFNGTILPEIAAPLALGVLIGATIGSRIMQRLSSFVIRLIFIPILLFMGIQMILRGFGVII